MRASSAMRAAFCVAFAGRKPSKKNRSVGSPETVSAVSTDDAPGIAMTAEARLMRRAHELEAGIGDQRRAGIRDQCDRGAFGDAREQLRARRLRIVLVIGRERRGNAVMAQ